MSLLNNREKLFKRCQIYLASFWSQKHKYTKTLFYPSLSDVAYSFSLLSFFSLGKVFYASKDFFWWIIMAGLFLEDCKTIDSGGDVHLRWSEANLLKHFQENFGRGSLYLVQYFEIFCSILKPFGRGFLSLVQYCNGFTGKSLQCWAATVFPFSTISNATATTLCTNAVGTVIKKLEKTD